MLNGSPRAGNNRLGHPEECPISCTEYPTEVLIRKIIREDSLPAYPPIVVDYDCIKLERTKAFCAAMQKTLFLIFLELFLHCNVLFVGLWCLSDTGIFVCNVRFKCQSYYISWRASICLQLRLSNLWIWPFANA